MIIIFIVKKKDIFLGYLAYFFKYTGNLIVLPFIVSNLTTSEFAIWNMILAISSFIFLIDMGYGVVIQRFVMYAFSGVDKIDYDLPKLVYHGEPNLKLLYQLMISSTKIYKRLSIISGVILLMITPYVIFISRSEFYAYQILLPWCIFSISTIVNMYILSDSTIIKGLGLVGDMQRITLVNSVFSTAIKAISLYIGLGIFGLSVSFLVSSLLLMWQYSSIIRSKINYSADLYNHLSSTFMDDFKDSYEIIKRKSRGIGGVLLSNFLQNQLFIIISPIFISLSLMGRYGLTWQIINIIASLAGITFSTFIMRIGNLLVSNKQEKLRETFSITVSLFFILYISGSIVTVLFGNQMLSLLGSQTSLLNIDQLLLVIIYTLIIQLNQKSTNIISLSNNQKYVKSLIVSSSLIAILNFVALYFGFGIRSILLIGIFVHSSYNLWKWGLESMKLCHVTFLDFFIQPLKKIKFYWHHFFKSLN